MGRYDGVKYWNGSSWVSPSEIRVWNGSEWKTFGSNTSDYTNQIRVWDGSSWKYMLYNKGSSLSGYTYSFGDWAVFNPNANGTWSRSNNTYFSTTNFNCTVPAGEASWDTLSWDLLDWNNYNGYGYATSHLNFPNVWRDFYFRWPNHNKWIHNIVFTSCNSSIWQGCPLQTEFWAGDRGTYIGTYTFTNPGAANTVFYTQGIDYKPNGGIKSITLAIYDGSGWKRGDSSLRMRATKIEGGDAYTNPVYTTTWKRPS